MNVIFGSFWLTWWQAVSLSMERRTDRTKSVSSEHKYPPCLSGSQVTCFTFADQSSASVEPCLVVFFLDHDFGNVVALRLSDKVTKGASEGCFEVLNQSAYSINCLRSEL